MLFRSSVVGGVVRLFSERDGYAMMKEKVYEGGLMVWDSFPKWFFIVPHE